MRGLLAVVPGEDVIGIKLDHRALHIGEGQRPRRARRNAVPLLALDAVPGQLLRVGGEVGIRRDLERQPRQCRLVAALERNRLKSGPGRQERAVLVALGDDQTHHVGVIRNLPIEVGRREGGVSDAPTHVDHVWCARTWIFSSPSCGSEFIRTQSPGFTGPTPSGVPV